MNKMEAIEAMRAVVKPGSTIHCILRHCSRSGMYRRISLVHMLPDGTPFTLDRLAIAAGVGNAPRNRNDDGIGVSGCGMDMGFSLVYELGRVLFPDGHECAGKTLCRSNDHFNGDRVYTPHHHKDGGYALHKVWL